MWRDLHQLRILHPPVGRGRQYRPKIFLAYHRTQQKTHVTEWAQISFVIHDDDFKRTCRTPAKFLKVCSGPFLLGDGSVYVSSITSQPIRSIIDHSMDAFHKRQCFPYKFQYLERYQPCVTISLPRGTTRRDAMKYHRFL